MSTNDRNARWVVALNIVKKGKDVDLYSEFHAPGTPNALTSLKLTSQTAI